MLSAGKVHNRSCFKIHPNVHTLENSMSTLNVFKCDVKIHCSPFQPSFLIGCWLVSALRSTLMSCLRYATATEETREETRTLQLALVVRVCNSQCVCFLVLQFSRSPSPLQVLSISLSLTSPTHHCKH